MPSKSNVEMLEKANASFEQANWLSRRTIFRTSTST